MHVAVVLSTIAGVRAALTTRGIQVLDGGGGRFPKSTCIRIDQADTKSIRLLESEDRVDIATQCCTAAGKCKRKAKIDTRQDQCVAQRADRLLPMNYSRARKTCEDLNLQLCDKNCAGTGCWYNNRPVWTNKPCDTDWKKIGPRFTRCASIIKYDTKVSSQFDCEKKALDKGFDYFQYQEKGEQGGLCGVAAYCYDTVPVKNPWQIYKNMAVVCTCNNGHAAESNDCPENDVEKCAWCYDGYTLVGNVCQPTILWSHHAIGYTCEGTVKEACSKVEHCQERATRKQHRWFGYNHDKKICFTSHYCMEIKKENKTENWTIYANENIGTQPKLEPELSRYGEKRDWSQFGETCEQYKRYQSNYTMHQRFLYTHNFLRCLHGHDPFFYDLPVAKNAKSVASEWVKSGFKWRDTYTVFDPPAAQSVSSNTTSSALWSTAAWYESIYDDANNFTWPGDDSGSQHALTWTAMVWRSSTKLGCWELPDQKPPATPNYFVQVCQYADSPSNVLFSFNKNVPRAYDKWWFPDTFCCQEAFHEGPDISCGPECVYQATRPLPDSCNDGDENLMVCRAKACALHADGDFQITAQTLVGDQLEWACKSVTADRRMEDTAPLMRVSGCSQLGPIIFVSVLSIARFAIPTI